MSRIPHISEPLFDAGTQKINDNWFRFLDDLARGQGLVLLKSGTASSVATIDIVLTGFTAYRGLTFALTNFIPATDNVDLWMRLSTDGGSNYDAGASNYQWRNYVAYSSGGSTAQLDPVVNDADVKIQLLDAVGNDSFGGASVHVHLMGQTNTAIKPRIWGHGSKYGADDLDAAHGFSGIRNTAQDTDAVRFLFSSGNIASGNWAVYGYA